MDITFSLPHVFNGHGNDAANAEALNVLLKAMVGLNLAYIRSTENLPRLYESGARYERGKIWQTTAEIYRTKRADCKSLAPALCAEYLYQGIPAMPVFRHKKRPDGSTLYHILVMVPNENGYEQKLYEDPSARLGMKPGAWVPIIL